MEECIFCKIIKGELPCSKVYEDEQVVAFLDLHPINFGHTLVVPKVHCNDLQDCDPEMLAQMMKVVQKVARGVVSASKADGFNLGVNNGQAAGQAVFHLHMHVIPRHKDDGLQIWGSKEYKEGEMEEFAEKIRNVI